MTFAVTDLFPSCMLYYLLLISKEVKDFIVRKIIYLTMLGQMATFYQEPEPCESSDIFMADCMLTYYALVIASSHPAVFDYLTPSRVRPRPVFHTPHYTSRTFCGTILCWWLTG